MSNINILPLICWEAQPIHLIHQIYLKLYFNLFL